MTTNKTGKACYDEAIQFEGSRPSGLLIQAGDEIFKLQALCDRYRSALEEIADSHDAPQNDQTARDAISYTERPT